MEKLLDILMTLPPTPEKLVHSARVIVLSLLGIRLMSGVALEKEGIRFA